MSPRPDLRVCHLYPRQLNIYADRGNIAVLERRCSWRGIGFEAVACEVGDRLPDADLYYLGGGQDRDQRLIAADLCARAGDLAAAVDAGAAVLGVCGGYQLLGHFYRDRNGGELRGLSLIDLETTAGERRMIGNIAIDCDLSDRRSIVVGFENHAGVTRLGAGVQPLGRVLHGHGNNGRDGGEGARAGRVLGTYVHGPLLPRNPALADHLIGLVLERRYGQIALEPLDDDLERQAHAVALTTASS